MKIDRIASVLLGFSLALLNSASFAEMHATAEFESGESRPVTVALLPAQVSLQKQRMIRREDQVEEAGELEGYLTRAIAGELVAKAYDVTEVTSDEINRDPDLQALVVEANRRYDELLGNVSRRLRKQIESRRYHAGDTITLLANRLGVDAIAFVRMQLVAAGKGVQVLNMGMGGAQTMMSVSLVDRNTTDIEAYVTLPIMRRGRTFGGYEAVMNNPDEEMAKYAEATLGDLLMAEPNLRLAEESGDDILGDLESLLE